MERAPKMAPDQISHCARFSLSIIIHAAARSPSRFRIWVLTTKYPVKNAYSDTSVA